MTVITLQDFNEKFLYEFPEMAEHYSIYEEEIVVSEFDGSDTYIDLDDYELNQLY